MTRDRDHWDREGGPGEVKGSKTPITTGKVMTREAMDALEKRRAGIHPSDRIQADGMIDDLFATVRDREAEIDALKKSVDRCLEAFTEELDFKERAEQVEAARDRLLGFIVRCRNVICSKELQAVCTLAHVHGSPYTGPHIAPKEFKEILTTDAGCAALKGD